jgi:hypothetical protein
MYSCDVGQEFAEFCGCLELGNRVELFERRGERVRETPEGSGVESGERRAKLLRGIQAALSGILATARGEKKASVVDAC